MGAQENISLVLSIFIMVLLVVVIVYLMGGPLTATFRPQTSNMASRAVKPAVERPAPQRTAPQRTAQPVRRYNAAYAAQAPMPGLQLMAAERLPAAAVDRLVSSASSSVGDAMQLGNTQQNGNSIAPFQSAAFEMDPATAASQNDLRSMDAFMPSMAGAVESADGLVDPATGLPVFTTSKLMRAQALGGYGAGSFLRPVQDPLSGYKKTIGKDMRGSGHLRHDLEVRRAQINAARLNDPNADPVLFQMSEFMYN